jgi:hypothetical protein
MLQLCSYPQAAAQSSSPPMPDSKPGSWLLFEDPSCRITWHSVSILCNPSSNTLLCCYSQPGGAYSALLKTDSRCVQMDNYPFWLLCLRTVRAGRFHQSHGHNHKFLALLPHWPADSWPCEFRRWRTLECFSDIQKNMLALLLVKICVLLQHPKYVKLTVLQAFSMNNLQNHQLWEHSSRINPPI